MLDPGQRSSGFMRRPRIKNIEHSSRAANTKNKNTINQIPKLKINKRYSSTSKLENFKHFPFRFRGRVPQLGVCKHKVDIKNKNREGGETTKSIESDRWWFPPSKKEEIRQTAWRKVLSEHAHLLKPKFLDMEKFAHRISHSPDPVSQVDFNIFEKDGIFRMISSPMSWSNSQSRKLSKSKFSSHGESQEHSLNVSSSDIHREQNTKHKIIFRNEQKPPLPPLSKTMRGKKEKKKDLHLIDLSNIAFKIMKEELPLSPINAYGGMSPESWGNQTYNHISTSQNIPLLPLKYNSNSPLHNSSENENKEEIKYKIKSLKCFTKSKNLDKSLVTKELSTPLNKFLLRRDLAASDSARKRIHECFLWSAHQHFNYGTFMKKVNNCERSFKKHDNEIINAEETLDDMFRQTKYATHLGEASVKVEKEIKNMSSSNCFNHLNNCKSEKLINFKPKNKYDDGIRQDTLSIFHGTDLEEANLRLFFSKATKKRFQRAIVTKQAKGKSYLKYADKILNKFDIPSDERY